MINSDLVLLDFYTDTCGSCQSMIPVIKELKNEVQVKIVEVDADKNRKLALDFGIRNLPTYVLFKEGKEIWRKSGMLSRRDFKELLADDSLQRF